MRFLKNFFRREPRPQPVQLPAFVDQSLFRFSLVVTVAVFIMALLACLAFAGCEGYGTRVQDPVPVSGKATSAAVEDARSKSSALFGTIGSQPDASAPTKRMAEVGEHLNGSATPQDYAWAEKIAASEKARVDAVALADARAAEISTLLAKLAAAPSPEELAKAKERADRVAAELDAFSSATARNGIIGVGVVLLCGFLAWQFNNPRIFGWGVAGSFALNLEPYVVKRIAESPVLGWTLGGLIVLGGVLAAWEALKGDKEKSSSAPGVSGGVAAWCERLRARLKAWFAAALLWIRTRFGKAPSAPTPPAQ